MLSSFRPITDRVPVFNGDRIVCFEPISVTLGSFVFYRRDRRGHSHSHPIESIAVALAQRGMSVVSPRSPTLYNFDSDGTNSPCFLKAMGSFNSSSELEMALDEQSFGIAGFELVSSTSSLESSALVTLLEGDVVHISLSARGYQV
jgi:hypothetical protein